MKCKSIKVTVVVDKVYNLPIEVKKIIAVNSKEEIFILSLCSIQVTTKIKVHIYILYRTIFIGILH